MWCWGCDVRRTQGNLLLAYGAEKRPAPDPRRASAYTLRLDAGSRLTLWGWGLWFARPRWGSLFISRSHFRTHYDPAVILTPQAWRARDLPPLSGTRDETEAGYASNLLAAALNWIGCYERWLCGQVEADYRERVLEKWPQRKQHKGGIPAAEMPTRWFELAEQIVQHNII
jgi:hypothetical protein